MSGNVWKLVNVEFEQFCMESTRVTEPDPPPASSQWALELYLRSIGQATVRLLDDPIGHGVAGALRLRRRHSVGDALFKELIS